MKAWIFRGALLFLILFKSLPGIAVLIQL